MVLQALEHKLDQQSRDLILAAFFGTAKQPALCSDYDGFFGHYERELKQLRMGVLTKSTVLSGLAVKKHADIAQLCLTLQQCGSLTREQIRLKVRQDYFPNDKDLSIIRSIDLTVRLWLMINIRDEELSVRTPYKPTVPWEESSSLQDVIKDQFVASTIQRSHRQSRLSPSFTVANMEKICGLEIKWTESLEDHLRLDITTKSLWVFPYKDFLVGHLHASTDSAKKRQALRNRGREGFT
ncbi:uncharacterized protein E0L32_006776 [Thyridium curvatum]|uniref:Uncharacterized protein n=1 Tax=Thyridium curvatum TaxID=1093900 RepID=A0A507B1H8_9PEZI|nr:uncharacterized protein E0L32_006776 [Thyridium curvatum]TPX12896.1 hypothetical protein E0L32_006776 [Thyridium curvatum]